MGSARISFLMPASIEIRFIRKRLGMIYFRNQRHLHEYTLYIYVLYISLNVIHNDECLGIQVV